MKATGDVPGLACRKAALQHLWHVLICNGRLTEGVRRDGDLAPADAARAMRLAESVLRNLNRADAVLDSFLKSRPKAAVMNILRLAVTEVFAEGEAPHAAVDQAVRLARAGPASRKVTGLVNAVLRRAAESGAETWNATRPKRLPIWMAHKLGTEFGDRVLRDIEIVHQRVPPLDVSARSASERHRLARELGAKLLPTGSLRLQARPQVSALPEYEAGTWWIQDAASAVPVMLLGNVSGSRVLDLCAAPGGKSLQCAALGAEVTALDRSARRIEILKRNFERTGLECTPVCKDALKWKPAADFDIVLVDPPCSATGTIRRNPDLPHAFRNAAGSLETLVEVQGRLLEAAALNLRAGGRVLYSVCSLLPDEGERVIDRFAEPAGLRVACIQALPDGVQPEWRTCDGGVRLRPDYWPELGGMDGFYAIVLEKA